MLARQDECAGNTPSHAVLFLVVAPERVSGKAVEESLEQGTPPISVMRVSDVEAARRAFLRVRFDAVVFVATAADAAATEAVRALVALAGMTPVLAVAADRGSAFVRDLLAAGVRGVLPPEHVNAASLVRVLEKVRASGAAAHATGPGRTGVTVGLVGAGGGVGTTTVLLNLAVLAASEHRSVLAIELAPLVGSFASQLRLEPRTSWADVLARPEAVGEELDRSVLRYPPGIGLLCAPAAPTASAVDAGRLDRLRQEAARRSDLVLVDLPRELPPEHERLVRHLDHVLMVLEPTATAVAEARRLVHRLRAWGVGTARLSGVVVNRRTPQSRSVERLQAACEELGLSISGIVPPAADTCDGAARAGVPLVASCPDHPASAALGALCRELMTEIQGLRLRAAIVSRSTPAADRLRELLEDADSVRFDVTQAGEVEDLLPELASGALDAVLVVRDGAEADPAPSVARITALSEATATVLVTADDERPPAPPWPHPGLQERLVLDRLDAYWLSHAIASSIARRRAAMALEHEIKDLVACDAELRRLVMQLLRSDHADPRMV